MGSLIINDLATSLSAFSVHVQLPDGRWGWVQPTQKSQTRPALQESWGKWAGPGTAEGLQGATKCWGLSEPPLVEGWALRPKGSPLPAFLRAARLASTSSTSARETDGYHLLLRATRCVEATETQTTTKHWRMYETSICTGNHQPGI